jgi:hypothetical protein
MMLLSQVQTNRKTKNIQKIEQDSEYQGLVQESHILKFVVFLS